MATTISSSLPAVRETREGLLRLAIRLDAAVSAIFGGALLAGRAPLDETLGVPSTMLIAVGGACLAYAAALAVLQSRTPIARRTGWTVVGANALWVLASVLLLLSGLLPLTPVGVALVGLQAVGVAGLAELQTVALLRSRRRPAS